MSYSTFYWSGLVSSNHLGDGLISVSNNDTNTARRINIDYFNIMPAIRAGGAAQITFLSGCFVDSISDGGTNVNLVNFTTSGSALPSQIKCQIQAPVTKIDNLRPLSTYMLYQQGAALLTPRGFNNDARNGRSSTFQTYRT
jgi:hypothetical protein